MSSFEPTVEQQKILDVTDTGVNVKIEAGAGSGKTATLKLIGERQFEKRGLYIAYNKAIQLDAEASFPSNVMCRTAHSLAYREVGRKFQRRLNSPRMPGRQAASLMGITTDFDVATTSLSPAWQARIVMEAISNFAHSNSDVPSKGHIPWVDGLSEEEWANLKDKLIHVVEDSWADLKSTYGRLKFDHDHYLKIWQLSKPQLDYDFVLLDEAQDSNPVIVDVVEGQADHSQIILVGDRSQAIYGWRGAMDAMENFKGEQLYLSQSFRFGQKIADEANKWLNLLDAPIQLKGYDKIDSSLDILDSPHAILCRSNAECVKQAINYQLNGTRVGLVGGGDDIKRLAVASVDLMNGKKSDHPQLVAFGSWADLRKYTQEDKAGSDLRVFVNLIDNIGAEAVIKAMDQLVGEQVAQVVISTAHKAKGREWSSVKIAPDFKRGETVPPESMPSRSEMMLNYVAVTRAKNLLDRSGLAWVDQVRKVR